MMVELNEHIKGGVRAGSYTPKKGEKVAAVFSEDGAWYRALVLKVSATAAEVRFVDYGNTEEVPLRNIAPLETSAALSHAPFAREATLALLGPAAQDYQSSVRAGDLPPIFNAPHTQHAPPSFPRLARRWPCSRTWS
jgi:hypothetical protein